MTNNNIRFISIFLLLLITTSFSNRQSLLKSIHFSNGEQTLFYGEKLEIGADLNGDKKKDVFMAGNFFGLKPQAGRFDASYGVTMICDSTDSYSFVTPSKSGLFVNGEVRDIKAVGGYIVVAVNNLPVKIFKPSQKFY